METEFQHIFLVQAESIKEACHQVTHFLQTSELVSYAQLNIDAARVKAGDSDGFWKDLQQGAKKNKEFSRRVLHELQAAGVHEVNDLLTLPLGYPSKLLHILTHMVDGFFGVDSFFYNLVEDSHWLGEKVEARIRKNPEQFWLVPVETEQVRKSVLPAADQVKKS